MIAAPVNNMSRWYRELNFIINNDEINYDVKITFATLNGNRVVNTHIVAVIEHYVKINEGVIIPMNSIVKVNFKEPVVTIDDNHERLGVIVFLIIVLLLGGFIVYLIVR